MEKLSVGTHKQMDRQAGREDFDVISLDLLLWKLGSKFAFCS